MPITPDFLKYGEIGALIAALLMFTGLVAVIVREVMKWIAESRQFQEELIKSAISTNEHIAQSASTAQMEMAHAITSLVTEMKTGFTMMEKANEQRAREHKRILRRLGGESAPEE